jgi:membrane-associated protease RseP (regulator of RpoE activity)
LTASALLILAAGAARAGSFDDSDAKDKKVEKHRVVVINEDGKEKVIEGDGPMVRRGYLGIGLTDLTPELRTHFGAPEESGVMVSKVEAGSPAEKAGLKVGDIISGVDGKAVHSSWDIGARIREYEEGQAAPLEVWRNGKVMTLTAAITLKERSEMDIAPLFLKHGEDGKMMLRIDPELGSGGHRIIRLSGGGEGDADVRVERLRTPREAELEKKLEALEKRLNELEAQLKQKK